MPSRRRFSRTRQKRSSRATIVPDISFDSSINPYRGCEHGCIYCYARPSHCYLGHSAGLDFETKLYAKSDAAALLERELAKPGYRPTTIALGGNTDPYQPIERERRITRSILEVHGADQPSGRHHHQVGARRSRHRYPAADGRERPGEGRRLDHDARPPRRPRDGAARRHASTPPRNGAAAVEAGIPVTVMVAPIIPGLTDHEIEPILEAARDAGARDAGYVLLRLPLEIKDLFREWLARRISGPCRAGDFALCNPCTAGATTRRNSACVSAAQGPTRRKSRMRFRLAKKRLGLGGETRRVADRPLSKRLETGDNSLKLL